MGAAERRQWTWSARLIHSCTGIHRPPWPAALAWFTMACKRRRRGADASSADPTFSSTDLQPLPASFPPRPRFGMSSDKDLVSGDARLEGWKALGRASAKRWKATVPRRGGEIRRRRGAASVDDGEEGSLGGGEATTGRGGVYRRMGGSGTQAKPAEIEVAVLSPPLEPHGTMRATRRARIVGAVLELYSGKLSHMPISCKIRSPRGGLPLRKRRTPLEKQTGVPISWLKNRGGQRSSTSARRRNFLGRQCRPARHGTSRRWNPSTAGGLSSEARKFLAAEPLHGQRTLSSIAGQAGAGGELARGEDVG
nr:unnamed protein product [Digitaria exilis]